MHKRSGGNRTSTDECLPHVLWGGYLTPKGIIDDGVGISTSSVGGKSEVYAVWYKVLTSKMYEGRLLRKIVLQAVECGRGSWMRSMGRCIGRFGWQDMIGGVVRELSVKCMLLSVVWNNIKDEWRKEVQKKPKLSMMKLTGECEVESSCALLNSKAVRRIMLKLRGRTAAFQIEMGRWHGMKRKERVCKECDI